MLLSSEYVTMKEMVAFSLDSYTVTKSYNTNIWSIESLTKETRLLTLSIRGLCQACIEDIQGEAVMWSKDTILYWTLAKPKHYSQVIEL